MLFLLLSAAFLGVVFELKIFNYAGFDFDTVMYFRIFSINTFIGPSIYLLVIAKELINLKFQKANVQRIDSACDMPGRWSILHTPRMANLLLGFYGGKGGSRCLVLDARKVLEGLRVWRKGVT